MSDVPRIPVSDDFSCSAHQLANGPLVPLVMEPLVYSWTTDTVLLRQGEHENTWYFPTPGAVPTGWDPGWDRDADLGWGSIKILRLSGTIDRPDTLAVHLCPDCSALKPWSVEWTSGAIEATGTVECLTCGVRQRGGWAAEVAALVEQQYDGAAEGDIEVDLEAPS